MEPSIKIYTFAWNTISNYQQFFSRHLLRYSIIFLEKPISGFKGSDFPVIKIKNSYFKKPTEKKLQTLLSLKERAINYSDFLILGSDIRALFALDYFAKKGFVSKCIGMDPHSVLQLASKQMTGMHFETANILPEMLVDDRIQEIKKEKGQVYFSVRTQQATYFTKAIFLTLKEDPPSLPLLYEEAYKKKFLFTTQESFFLGMKKKRFRNMKERVFFLICEKSEMIFEVPSLLERIRNEYQSFDFQLNCLFQNTFSPSESAFLDVLGKEKRLHIFEHLKVKKVLINEKTCILETELKKHTVDCMLLLQNPKPINFFLKGTRLLGSDGQIVMDEEGRTNYPNVVASEAYVLNPGRKLQLKDTFDDYLAVAARCQILISFLHVH